MITFSNHNKTENDPAERVIATELWRWVFLPPESREEITEIRSPLSLAIEFYLSGAFHQIGFTCSRGIWCDGIVELSIKHLNRCVFLLYGVAYCPDKLAPFEIELYFAKRRDLEFQRVIIRFGEHDPIAGIRFPENQVNVDAIVQNRPRTNQDWAVAVELTHPAPH